MKKINKNIENQSEQSTLKGGNLFCKIKFDHNFIKIEKQDAPEFMGGVDEPQHDS